jgi:hypothetical protein
LQEAIHKGKFPPDISYGIGSIKKHHWKKIPVQNIIIGN